MSAHSGSSPHPWGTLPGRVRLVVFRRFIPAPAGNARNRAHQRPVAPVHPRTRGEHIKSACKSLTAFGSSPHPWGTLQFAIGFSTIGRFIPTPVGNANAQHQLSAELTVHPRTRGERRCRNSRLHRWGGSSPHPRGTRQSQPHESPR